MIVEDEVIVGMDLIKKVESLGYNVEPTVIRYGEDVLEAAQKVEPDLILMDIRLKGETDGTQAASIVQDQLGLPVIFLTAYSDSATLRKAKLAEPYAYLKKPVRIEDLKISLEIALYKAQMEKQLKKSELRYRTVADYTYDWETWIGPNGKYRYVSPSCERVTGYHCDKFYRDEDFFDQIIHPHDRETVRNMFKGHLTDSKEDCFSVFRIVRSDGDIRWIEHICQPVCGPGGIGIGRRGSNRDITERKKLEVQLENKISELQDALDNIKTLSGLIPICANCKKIRDDKGYWNLIESYIQKHSKAQFSHSMCPDCMDETYGHEDWYQDMKGKYNQNASAATGKENHGEKDTDSG